MTERPRPEAQISSEEQERWRECLNRMLVIVSDPIAKDGLFDPRSGTGALVRIAERDFIFSAGHNFRDMKREEIALCFRHPLFSLPWIQDKDVSGFWFNAGYRDQPDVAVLELNLARRNLWRDYQPIELRDFARWQHVDDETRVIVAGYPAAKQAVRPSEAPLDLRTERVKLTHSVTSVAISVVTKIRRDITTNEHAPPDGRCFHVGWEHIARSAGIADYEQIPPHGVSGGPVFTIDGAFRYIGIERSNFEDRALLCEPVVEALKLIRDHADDNVRTQVRDAIARLDGSPI